MGFVVDRVALRQDFLHVLQFEPCQYYSSIVPYSFSYHQLYNQKLTVSLGNNDRYCNRNIPLHHGLNTTHVFTADNSFNLLASNHIQVAAKPNADQNMQSY